jgi:hypothetical protein
LGLNSGGLLEFAPSSSHQHTLPPAACFSQSIQITDFAEIAPISLFAHASSGVTAGPFFGRFDRSTSWLRRQRYLPAFVLANR